MAWGTDQENYWGNDDKNSQAAKKVKDQGLFQNIFKEGNWGHGPNKNLGLFGFRGTPQENAEIGRQAGKAKIGRDKNG